MKTLSQLIEGLTILECYDSEDISIHGGQLWVGDAPENVSPVDRETLAELGFSEEDECFSFAT